MNEDYHVPTSAPVYECAYCGRPFACERFRALHRGLEHASDLDDDEVERFRDAYREEAESIGMFRLKALAALVLVYFGLLMIYATL
ncbi:DUF7410 domain-containing protein [Halomicrobium katesii]|uniref:DUF7410 domain-containing protein n=1 Tax=Halomicrobium katesii TaxID=437163 RepID=UPI0003759222|nr:hypothetical protein [Halomicrobium katesii]